MFWAAQRDEVKGLDDELLRLRAYTLKGTAERSKQDAHALEEEEEQGELQRAWAELNKLQGDLEAEMKVLGEGIEGVAPPPLPLPLPLPLSRCSARASKAWRVRRSASSTSRSGPTV